MKSGDYWENTAKTLCSRCDKLHRWNPDACTEHEKADGTVIDPKLTSQEFALRLKKRWDRGFYFSKPIGEYKSPSAQDSAQSSANTSHKLKNDSKNA